MKLEKLLTLSQFVDYIDNRSLSSKYPYDDEYQLSYEAIVKYNDFLKQPLTKDMFVNSLKKPKISMYQNNDGTNDVFMFNHNYHEWQEAEKKVIFNCKENEYKCLVFENQKLGMKWLFMNDLKLSDLAEATNGELKLKNVEL